MEMQPVQMESAPMEMQPVQMESAPMEMQPVQMQMAPVPMGNMGADSALLGSSNPPSPNTEHPSPGTEVQEELTMKMATVPMGNAAADSGMLLTSMHASAPITQQPPELVPAPSAEVPEELLTGMPNDYDASVSDLTFSMQSAALGPHDPSHVLRQLAPAEEVHEEIEDSVQNEDATQLKLQMQLAVAEAASERRARETLQRHLEQAREELALERSKNDKLEQQAASPPKAAPMPQTEPAPELVPATSCTCVVC
eukprot:TRINITY_DN2570_c0_g1_i1.p1 TRINITY_DN2570_c0_g1~~TRINITY_DN2570_c0_g1_i1.p1  ORF type:complete len:254 (-),score=87.70 TRINITY_DN2570_c0_g1_i1:97-858(-)